MCVDFHSHLQPHKLNETRSSSVDYTNEHDNSANLNQSSSSFKSFSKFSLTKDTSIINYWDTNSTVTACVHHFTLYDLAARGFVRPFCLAYISYEKNKPIGFFDQIRNRFTEITDLLKKSNFNLFKHELDQRCLDLKFTRDFFSKWSNGKPDGNHSSSNTTDQEKLDYRLKLAEDFKIDKKTFARLNASCSNEQIKNLQISAIDNLFSEMENVLSVVHNELKVKNWFIKNSPKEVKTTLISNLSMEINENDNGKTFQKSTSAVDPKLLEEEMQLKERSLTYPIGEFPTLNLVNQTLVNNISKSKEKDKYRLSRPKLVKTILIENLSLSGFQNANAGIDFLNMGNSEISLDQQQNQPKIMKRFHQLCSDTARQAINELRLMQRHFSTPYHLLKYKELTRMGNSEIFSYKNNQNARSNSSNLFWSITLGNSLIADFSTNIDTFNLNKYALIKKSNIYNRNVKISNISKFNKKVFNFCFI
jgi:hypothetical protein